MTMKAYQIIIVCIASAFLIYAAIQLIAYYWADAVFYNSPYHKHISDFSEQDISEMKQMVKKYQQDFGNYTDDN